MSLRHITALGTIPLVLALTMPLFSLDEPKSEPAPADGAKADAPAAPEPPPIVDVTEVATAAQTATSTFQRIEKALAADQPEMQVATSALETWRRTIPAAASEARETLQSTGSITNVDELRNSWLDDERKVKAVAGDLIDYVQSLRADLASLRQIEALWQRSLDSFQGTAPETAVNRAQEVIARATALASRVLQRRDDAIVVQDALGEIKFAMDGVLEATVEARLRLQRQLFTVDVDPLWTVLADEGLRLDLEPVQREWTNRMQALEVYLVNNRTRFYLQVVISVAMLALVLALRHTASSWTEKEREDRQATLLLRRPIAAAVGISVLLSGFVHIRSVLAYRMLLVPVVVVVVLRLLWLLLERRGKLELTIATGFYVLDYSRGLLWNEPSLERVVLLLEAIAGLVCLIVLSVASGEESRGSPRRIWIRGLLLTLFSIGGLCLVVGFFGMGRLITYATARLPFTGFAFLSAYFVLRSAVAVALHTPLVRRLHMVARHTGVLQRQLTRAVGIAVSLIFVVRVLELYTISDPLLDVVRGVLVAPLEVGSLSVSLGKVLIFVTVAWLSFQISKLVRFVFQEEVFSRTAVPYGARYAASAALHYTVLTVGFIAAILAAGVDISRFALLGGALGIGVGFGLQNVVNNFVSGLILLFERPIQIGDRIELDTVAGEVRRIGIRSSTVRTFDGAEVIVPNSDLIANKLTNWTLTDRRRRLIVRIGVKYGTDPDRVLALLRRVAQENDDVLRSPEPVALFRSHGESSLDFELRVWTERSDDWLRVESDLTTAVNRILTAENIEIPFPQRDVHVRSSDVPLVGQGPATGAEPSGAREAGAEADGR